MKIITLGLSNVGKSSFIKKILTNEFSSFSVPTIGVDYNKIYYKEHEIIIWDTAGQEYYNAISSQYYKNTDVGLIFFDLTSEESFNCLENKINDFLKYNSNSPVFLIGNKKDLIDKNTFDSRVKDFCYKYNTKYFEISCKNDNLTFILDELIKLQPLNNVKFETIKLIDNKPIPKKNKCC